jgi:hypothetical protein
MSSYASLRIRYASATVNSAEFRERYACYGFDFASRSQPPVERVADQALAREKTLPKSSLQTTPTAIMAGPGSVIRCARKRKRFRARERRQSGGRGNAERNCLSPAPVRGRRVPDPSPAMIATTTPRTQEERLNHQAHQIHQAALPLAIGTRSARSANIARCARGTSVRCAENLGGLGVLGGSIFLRSRCT